MKIDLIKQKLQKEKNVDAVHKDEKNQKKPRKEGNKIR